MIAPSNTSMIYTTANKRRKLCMQPLKSMGAHFSNVFPLVEIDTVTYTVVRWTFWSSECVHDVFLSKRRNAKDGEASLVCMP